MTESYNSYEEYQIKIRLQGWETKILFLDGIIKESLFKGGVLWEEFYGSREWAMWMCKEDHFSRGNRKWGVLRWDFVLYISYTEKPVRLEGTEGRN